MDRDGHVGYPLVLVPKRDLLVVLPFQRRPPRPDGLQLGGTRKVRIPGIPNDPGLRILKVERLFLNLRIFAAKTVRDVGHEARGVPVKTRDARLVSKNEMLVAERSDVDIHRDLFVEPAEKDRCLALALVRPVVQRREPGRPSVIKLLEISGDELDLVLCAA